MDRIPFSVRRMVQVRYSFFSAFFCVPLRFPLCGIVGFAVMLSAVSVASAVGIVVYVIRHRGRARPRRAISESAAR